MKNILLVLVILAFMMLNVKCSWENFEEVNTPPPSLDGKIIGTHKYVLFDGLYSYEMVSYSQLSNEMKEIVLDNLPVLNINEKLLNVELLKYKAVRHQDIYPDNDILFAVKKEDINNEKVVDKNSIITLNKYEDPLYLPNSHLSSRSFTYRNEQKLEDGKLDPYNLYIVDNNISITYKANPRNAEFKNKLIDVENNKINNKDVILRGLQNNNNLFKIELTDDVNNAKNLPGVKVISNITKTLL
jgi:hypothetical protein